MLYRKSVGNGDNLYLLHGWAMNSRVWDPVLDRLQRNWRVISIDLPGHGKSDPINSAQISLDTMADKLVEVIKPGARIIGWSLGGMLALNIAYRYPQLIKQLVIVACSPRFTRSQDWPCAVEPKVIQGFAADLLKDYRATILRFLALQTLGSQHARLVTRQMRDSVFINGEPYLATLVDGLRLLTDSDLRTAIAQVTCPTLIVLGEKDTMTPACSGVQTQQLIPGSQLTIIAGAGHAPFISHTQEFLTAVNGFLQAR